MGKGSSKNTTTVVDPTQQMQAPYLGTGWEAAQNLYQNNPSYPLAQPANDKITRGLDQLYWGGQYIDQALRPQAADAWQQGAQGTVYNSPAYNYWQNLAQGAAGSQQQLTNIGNTAQNVGYNYGDAILRNAPNAAQYGANAAAGNLGLSALGQTAQGAYLNANPYMAAMVQAAMDPVTRNYQTALAPQLDASFAGSGRYGSGAMLGARDTAQQNLGRTLADMSSNLYGQQYARERQLQDAAAQQYGQLYNQGQQLGMQGATSAANITNAAGNQYLAGLQQAGQSAYQNLVGQQAGASGLQGGYQSGIAALQNAASQYPALAQGMVIPAQLAMQAGQGFNQLYQQQADAPYTALDKYLAEIGNPSGRSSTTTAPGPDPVLGAISGLTGAVGLGKNLGLFGGGTGLASALPSTVGGASSLGMASALSGAPEAAGLSMAAPMAAGAWIICTELKRQGRMPWRHWAAGVPVFDAYPEIAKRGYYVWAIPTVRHLRRRPQSLYSRLCATAFGWRAEDLAAKAGVKGARRLLRGRLLTAALALPCLLLGAVAPEQDWRQVYGAGR